MEKDNQYLILGGIMVGILFFGAVAVFATRSSESAKNAIIEKALETQESLETSGPVVAPVNPERPVVRNLVVSPGGASKPASGSCDIPSQLKETPKIVDYKDSLITFKYDSANLIVKPQIGNGVNNEVALSLVFKNDPSRIYASIFTTSFDRGANPVNAIEDTYKRRLSGDANYNAMYTNIVKTKLGNEEYYRYNQDGCSMLIYDTVFEAHISLTVMYNPDRNGGDKASLAAVDALVSSIRIVNGNIMRTTRRSLGY
jgi:hypothetical protein